MKLVVAGSREFADYDLFDSHLIAIGAYKADLIIHGGARGTDSMANRFANECGLPVSVFEADWDQYGKAAGPIRNRLMAEQGEVLVAFWDFKSPGTKSIIKEMRRLGKPAFIVPVVTDSEQGRSPVQE